MGVELMNAKFTPAGDAPAIELVCGKHDKRGKFHPKNIKLTSIARLRYFKNYDVHYVYDWREPRIPMAGYPRDERGIYEQMMREKKCTTP
jgi:hypothetical protein